MNTDITITVDQLIHAALKRYALNQTIDTEILLAQTINDLYPNGNGETVRAKVLINSLTEAIEKAQRKAAAHENAFAQIAQMALPGILIPEHKIPKQLLPRSVAEVKEWSENRAAIERENADELRRAAKSQERKAEKFENWSKAVDAVYQAILDMGLDPESVTYEEAIKKAETFRAGFEQLSSKTAKQPLR